MKKILLISLTIILLLTACSYERQKLSPQANLDKKSAGIYYKEKDNQNSLKKAKELYEKVLKDNPDYVLALKRLGDINFYFGEIQTSEIKAAEEAKNPQMLKEATTKELQFYREAYLKYSRAAQVLEMLGKQKPLNEEERAFYRDTVRRRDNMLERMTNRGIKQYKDKDNKSAIQTLEMVASLDPKNTKPLKVLVSVYQEENNNNKVEEYLLKIAEITPEDKDILSRLGSFYYLKNDFEKALSYFEKVQKLDNRNVDNLKFIADCYVSMKDYTKALSTVQQILTFEPNNVSLMVTAGNIAQQLDNIALELEYKKRAADKEPSTNIFSDLCLRLANLQKYDELMIYAEKWYQYDQTSKEAASLCLLAAQQIGDKDKEIKYSAIIKRLE